MRKPRKETLSTTGLFHKMWRGHNREPVFEDDEDKRGYLRNLKRAYTGEIAASLVLFCFVLMLNHTHEVGGPADRLRTALLRAVELLGNWMRNAHSWFGAEFNRRHNRQGKVAYDRPKTKEIDSDRGVLDVMFYCDANPVRAGKVSHPSRYRWSSHRFYAYGEKNEYTDMLTPPPAYLALGETPEARQRKYRSLVDDYLRKNGLLDDRPSEDVAEPVEADDRAVDGAGHELARRDAPAAEPPPEPPVAAAPVRAPR